LAFLDNIKARLAGDAAGGSGTSQTRIVVGLGNPGERYAATRHNAGFLAVDAVTAELDVSNWRARFDSLVAEKRVDFSGGEEGHSERTLLVLAKPQTMMNSSGRAVKGLLKHYKLDPESLIVVQDDLDLPPGALRIKEGGGHGGHNGIRDIIAEVGAGFIRVKIGVGRAPGRMDSFDYVLQQLKGTGLEELRVDAARAADATLFLLKHGLTETQNRFN
jgi:PTH1 family peptidyl-tRNA hydrolase